jgi:hypothetical protein
MTSDLASFNDVNKDEHHGIAQGDNAANLDDGVDL